MHETVSETIARSREGELEARDELQRLLDGSLRELAAGILRRRGPSHSLDVTDLVHEACMRLLDRAPVAANDRAHLLAIAGMAMRQVLASRGRARQADKRGGGWQRVTLSALAPSAPATEIDALLLSEALERLARIDPHQAQLVELRFFSGLEMRECSEVMDVPLRTLERHWRSARAWLRVELDQQA